MDKNIIVNRKVYWRIKSLLFIITARAIMTYVI